MNTWFHPRCQMIQESSRASWNQQRQRTDARCCVHFDHFVWGPPPWCKRMIKWSFRSFMPFMPHFAKDVSWWILSLQSLIFWCRMLLVHNSSIVTIQELEAAAKEHSQLAAVVKHLKLAPWFLCRSIETRMIEKLRNRFLLWALMFGLYQGSTPTSERCRKLGTSTLAFKTWIQGSCDSDVLFFFQQHCAGRALPMWGW